MVFLPYEEAAWRGGISARETSPGRAPPEDAGSWGWRSEPSAESVLSQFRPQGDRIGWIEGTDVYLEPEAAFAACQNAQDFSPEFDWWAEHLPHLIRQIFIRLAHPVRIKLFK